MHRIFLPIYRFFQKHQPLMYILLFASSLIFAWYGLKLQYEEDIIKLLPRSATSGEVAFTDIGLAEKVFIQVTSRDTLNPVEPALLGEAAEEFCRLLEQKDSATHFITGTLCSLDIDTGFEAIDFALTHLPSFVDTSWYSILPELLTREAIDAQMEKNARLVMEDETGDVSQLVSMDPLNIRAAALQRYFGGDGSLMGGFGMEDGHIFCPDMTAALAFVTPSFSSTNSGKCTRMVKMMNKARKEFEAEHPDIRILLHGNPMSSVSNAGTIKKDLALTLGLSLLVILLIMLLSFHNFYFVWQQVVPVLYGAFFAMACMYWIKGSLSLMALGISAIVLGVAISYCLHVLIHFYYVGDAEKMLRDESTPVFMGCITTIGAFIGLLFTESELLRDFGLFASLALLGNTLFALIFLPHFLHPQQIKFKRSHGFPLVERINNLPWDRNKWVIAGMFVIIAVGIVFSPRVKFDSDLMHLDYDDPDLRESQALYNSKNADGYTHMYFAAWDDDQDQALTYNQQLFPVLDSLKETGLVKAYSPLTRLLLVSIPEQEERIAQWNAFWSRGRVAELRRNLREADPAVFPALHDHLYALRRGGLLAPAAQACAAQALPRRFSDLPPRPLEVAGDRRGIQVSGLHGGEHRPVHRRLLRQHSRSAGPDDPADAAGRLRPEGEYVRAEMDRRLSLRRRHPAHFLERALSERFPGRKPSVDAAVRGGRHRRGHVHLRPEEGRRRL